MSPEDQNQEEESPDELRRATPEEAKRLIWGISLRLNYGVVFSSPDLYMLVASNGEGFDYATQNIINNGLEGIENILERVGFFEAKQICIGSAYGEVYFVETCHFKRDFGHIWQPLADDVVIFDPNDDWCFSINENGGACLVDRRSSRNAADENPL